MKRQIERRSRLILHLAAFPVIALAVSIPAIAADDGVRSGTARCYDEEICFDPSVTVGGVELPLLGIGKARYWGFSLYVAALYGPADAKSSKAVLGDVPKRLVLHYLRSFKANDFIVSGEKTIRKNPEVVFTAIEPSLRQMDKLYQPVREGDRYSLTYIPSQGLTLDLNGKELGRINDATFAAAYLGIWIGEYSLSEDLTASLLGRTAG